MSLIACRTLGQSWTQLSSVFKHVRPCICSQHVYGPSVSSSSSSGVSLLLLRRPYANRFLVEEVEPPPKPDGSENIITVPIHLRRRLEKKVERESTRGHIRQEIVKKSREGRKSQVLISCKRPEFNHYFGQTYERGKDPALASGSWQHRKASGDWFIIKPMKKVASYGFADDSDITFADLGVNEELIRRLNENKAFKPTLIQELAIPRVLEGNNHLITAETGSGKSLAYLVPLVQQIMEMKSNPEDGRRGVNLPLALILVPSHELASQIYYVASKLSEGLDINIKLLEGGNIGSKVSSPPSTFMDLLISTVNVFSKLRTFGVYHVAKVQHLILDEADTLLDDSFAPDVLDILHGFQFDPRELNFTQLSLVSATMPKTVESTLEDTLPLETLRYISTPNIHYVMSHVPQHFLRVRKSEKPEKLLEIVKSDLEKQVPVMIFSNRTKTCDWMEIFFKEHGIPHVKLHGETRPSWRRGRMQEYQNGEVNVMICTDLGSRGLNTVRTQHVLNYEFPTFTADYIHRCGRTGRIGSVGQCKITNFISRRYEFDVVREIERSVRQESSIGKVNANIKRLIHARYGMYQPIVSDEQTENE